MIQAKRNSVLEFYGTRPWRPPCCEWLVSGARLMLTVAVALIACNCVVAAGPPTKPTPSARIIRGVGSAPVPTKPAELDGDIEETVPISRVVPKAKTIPPREYQVRRLPTDVEKPEIQWSDDRDLEERTDETSEESDADEDVVVEEIGPPVRHNRRDRERPLKKGTVPLGNINLSQENRSLERDSPLFQQPASQPPTRAALRETVPVATRPPDPQNDRPVAATGQYPELDQTIEIINPQADLLAPEGQGYVVDEPWPQDPAAYDMSCPPQNVHDCHCWGPFKNFRYFNQTNGDIGIGHERVMFAPFEIETSQPANNFRLKMMSAFDQQTPDRAEYLWAKIGGPGPALPEKSVNYQNFDAIYEAGGNRFSFVTDIPLRYVHPDNNAPGAGIGNISLAPKVVLVSGNDWQITQIFRTYLPTGGTSRGTSNGLVSLEPGVLVRYRWSPRTYVHSQLKYWIPLTGDPIASGNVFNYGLGVSHVLYETDTFAIIPVLEAVGWTVGGGTATLPTGLTESANTTFVNIQPGARFVLGPKGDLGLCELGIGGGFATNATGWYQEQLTVEIRWSW